MKRAKMDNALIEEISPADGILRPVYNYAAPFRSTQYRTQQTNSSVIYRNYSTRKLFPLLF